MNRRGFLSGVTAASLAGIVGLTTATEPAAATNVDESAMTEREVDVSEGEEVSGIVENVSSGELLVFPSGTFSWSDTAEVYVEDWGIRCQSDTVFDVPAGFGDGEQALLLRTVNGNLLADNFLLENLTFDSSGRAAPGMRLGVANDAHVDGLHYRMDGPQTHQSHENGISAKVVNSDGRLRIDDYRQFNNGDLGGYASGDTRVGIYVAKESDGTVRLVNPVLQGFPNNACYVSRHPGTVVIEGGLLMNNNVSAVRVSGGVEVRDTTIYIDTDRYTDGPGVIDGSTHNTRGVWGDNRQDGTDGGLVTGVSFVLQSYRTSHGLADILENTHMTIRDSQFLLNDDIEAVRADAGEIEVSDSNFDGDATGATAGVGDVTGSGNRLAPGIDPGQVTAEGVTGYEFDWISTHPGTPERPPASEIFGHVLEVRTDADTDSMNYAFTVTGEVVPGSNTSDASGISRNRDGTYAVTGTVGHGCTDDYYFEGEIENWTAEYDTDAYTLVITTTGEARSLDPDGDGTPSTDPDGDGRYEDVDGDGVADVADVSGLLNNMKNVSRDSSAYDFNRDGTFSLVDVSELLSELSR